MQRYGVLFVHDPVVALDLAEILTAKLGPMQLYFPTSATEAASLLKDAVCVVTDQLAHTNLEEVISSISIPQLHLGTDQEKPLSAAFARIEEPFTNVSVLNALNALGLVT